MMEKIKRDNDRVDIAKLDPWDTAGIDLTGGYILKIDKGTGGGGEGWTSSYPPPVHPQDQTIYFQYEYPEFADLQPQQIDYIQAYVDTFETVLYDYGQFREVEPHDYMDLESFADYFILNELSKNVDGYRLSTFFYKDKGGKLKMGPLWDFDIAWHNADYCDAYSYEGWAYRFGLVCPDDYWQVPFWWNKLMAYPEYVQTLRCNWEMARLTVISDDSLMAYIDGVADTLAEAQERNFFQWPILGYWIWPNPYPLAETYQEEVDALKGWILLRLAWLDDNIPGICPNLSVPDSEELGIKVYPNPAHDWVILQFPDPVNEDIIVEFIDPTGRMVISHGLSKGKENQYFDVSHLTEGMYMIKVSSGKAISLIKLIKN
jgi:hypothetical protein